MMQILRGFDRESLSPGRPHLTEQSLAEFFASDEKHLEEIVRLIRQRMDCRLLVSNRCGDVSIAFTDHDCLGYMIIFRKLPPGEVEKFSANWD
jgi:hypothetical protein